jgi:hypothetical protein
MTRAFSVLSLVAALAIGGYIFTAQASQRAQGSQASENSHAIAMAHQVAATSSFGQAATALEAQRAETGSYAGTDLSSYGVVLVRGDASTYCIQAGAGTAVTHEDGPGAAAAAGPC